MDSELREQLRLIREEVRYIRDWMLRHQGRIDSERRSFERGVKIVSLVLLTLTVTYTVVTKAVL